MLRNDKFLFLNPKMDYDNLKIACHCFIRVENGIRSQCELKYQF